MGNLVELLADVPVHPSRAARMDDFDADDKEAIKELHTVKKYSAGDIAKILKGKGVRISQNTVRDWLRAEGVYWDQAP